MDVLDLGISTRYLLNIILCFLEPIITSNIPDHDFKDILMVFMYMQ